MKNYGEIYRRIGLNISYYRKVKGLTQEDLAELAHISRSYLSCIEAPNIAQSFSIATFFDIANALGVEPQVLFEFR